jgi:hypothetical protein
MKHLKTLQNFINENFDNDPIIKEPIISSTNTDSRIYMEIVKLPIKPNFIKDDEDTSFGDKEYKMFYSEELELVGILLQEGRMFYLYFGPVSNTNDMTNLAGKQKNIEQLLKNKMFYTNSKVVETKQFENTEPTLDMVYDTFKSSSLSK